MSLPGLGLPGLGLEQPLEQSQKLEVTQHELSPGFEWRFEVAFGKLVKVRLLSGTAEIFGSELIKGPTYVFSGTKAAIFTHHGCTIETSNDAPQSEYTAEETPMTEYINVNFVLEGLRDQAKAQGIDGPRVLVLGPSNAGKTSVVKILTAYAIRAGRQPIVANLDPEEGLLSLPGTLTAVAFKTLLDVEEGWGSSPMSGPSPNPVKLPLVYSYGLRDPTINDASADYYKSVISKLALAVIGRQKEDLLAKESGLLVDTPGTLANTNKLLTVNIIQHIVSEFAISHILILGSERLYSDMHRQFDNHPTSSTSTNPITSNEQPERMTVAKISKSGGCVDRDNAFMRAHRAAQIRAYFLGTPHLSNGVALSPRQQQIDFNQLAIYRLILGDDISSNNNYQNNGTINPTVTADLFRPGGQDEVENDDLDNFATTTTTTTINHQHHHNLNNPPSTNPTNPLPHTTSTTKTPYLTRLAPQITPPPQSLTSHTLTIMNADPEATTSDILTSSVLGFVYVTEVDEAKGGKVGLLSPIPGRMPRRAMLWSRAWPEEVVGVV